MGGPSGHKLLVKHSPYGSQLLELSKECKKVNRPISTPRLNTLLRLHLVPINQIVFLGSHGKSHLEVGFALICFQRLSRPNIATRQCPWQNNRYTRGSFTPVLSY